MSRWMTKRRRINYQRIVVRVAVRTEVIENLARNVGVASLVISSEDLKENLLAVFFSPPGLIQSVEILHVLS